MEKEIKKNGIIEKIKSDRRYKIAVGSLLFIGMYFVLDAFMKFDNDLITGSMITFAGMILGAYFRDNDKKEEDESKTEEK